MEISHLLSQIGAENQNQPILTGLTGKENVNGESGDSGVKVLLLGQKQAKNTMGALGLEPRTYALKGEIGHAINRLLETSYSS